MFLTQICNVGSIIGGTAACAWSVTRALPEWRHRVIFLSPTTHETRQAFAPVEIMTRRRVTVADVLTTNKADAEVVIFHNTPADRCGRLAMPTVGYRHSRCRMIGADVRVDCSRWLASGVDGSPVLWQGVPRPVSTACDGRGIGSDVVIGRICTPRLAKWPDESIDLTANLAAVVPEARFEFVGCPEAMQSRFQHATNDRATFVPASWSARDRLAEWDLLVYSNASVTESFGRTVAEAMRAGCVPIVDRGGGFVEQLENGGGVLCDTQSDFCDAVERLADPFERRAVSRRAVAIGNECFSLAAFRKRLLRVMGPLVRGGFETDVQSLPAGCNSRSENEATQKVDALASRERSAVSEECQSMRGIRARRDRSSRSNSSNRSA